MHKKNEKVTNLHISETFLMISWETRLEQHRIYSKLSKKKWIISINLCEKLNAFMSLQIVRSSLIEIYFTSRTTEKYAMKVLGKKFSSFWMVSFGLHWLLIYPNKRVNRLMNSIINSNEFFWKGFLFCTLKFARRVRFIWRVRWIIFKYSMFQS